MGDERVRLGGLSRGELRGVSVVSHWAESESNSSEDKMGPGEERTGDSGVHGEGFCGNFGVMFP